MRGLLTLIAVAGLGLAGVARGAELTDELVVGYVESVAEVETLVEDYEARGEITWNEERFKPRRGEEWAPMSEVVAEMQGLSVYDAFVEIIRNHGFDSPAQWGDVGDRVTKAMVAIQMQEESPEIEAEMAESLRQIDESPDLSPEQKAMMRQSMEGAMAMIEVMADAPPEDIEAVRPHLPLLLEVMNEEETNEEE